MNENKMQANRISEDVNHLILLSATLQFSEELDAEQGVDSKNDEKKEEIKEEGDYSKDDTDEGQQEEMELAQDHYEYTVKM